MKRKQVTAACLMAATMLFSGCTPNISEYAARAQQAGKSFWEGETTDAMAQDSDAAAIAEGETSEAGETQNVSTGTGHRLQRTMMRCRIAPLRPMTRYRAAQQRPAEKRGTGDTAATAGTRDACGRRNADRHRYRICGSNSSSNSGP